MRVVQLAAILTISLVLYLAHQTVTIRVRPQVIMAGQAFWLTCQADPNPDNRLWDYGVVPFREHSQQPIEGDKGPNLIQVLIEHVPCEAGPAYCQVGRLDGQWERAVQPLTVAGCDP